jgi:lipopolysaccharide/colanic/teichoic acid biosynthesis glycosyltransferase
MSPSVDEVASRGNSRTRGAEVLHTGGKDYGFSDTGGGGGKQLASDARAPEKVATRRYGAYAGKRLLDITLASVLLLVALPIILLVAFAVSVSSRGPVLYGHERIGRNGRRFRCLKFRTMCVDADERLERLLASDPDARAEYEASYKLKNDPRVTRIGGAPRRSSLDELPQLLNVLSGDMSLVGPRPVVADELELYERHQEAYLSARPGLTGAWQVSGRSDISYDERVALDVDYLHRQSPREDAAILCRTVVVVAKRVGAY